MVFTTYSLPLRRQLAVAGHDVVKENHHNLVAVKQQIFAAVVADNAADTVGVGVGSQDNVGVHFLALGDSHCHCRSILGVGGIHSGEIAGGNILFGNMDNVGEAIVAQRVGNELHTGAVDRGVYNLEVGVALDHLGVERQSLDIGKELLVHSVADNLDKFRIALELDVLYGFDTVNVVDDIHIVRGDNLCAVAPVCLIAVVLLGVVRSGDVYAALAAQLTDSIGEFGSRTERIEQIYLDAVGRENVCDDFSEFAGVVTHVVAHNNTYLGQVGESLVQIVGEALGCSAYGVYVHAVGACAHNAAETAGAEFKVAIERIDKFGLVVSGEHAAHLCLGFFVVAIAEPGFSLCCYLGKEFIVFHIGKLCLCYL